MNLSEDDIYNNLESYRNKMGYSQEKMAKIVGLSTKQAYLNMVKKKTMKLKYLVNLINNTGLSSGSFIDESTKRQLYEHREQISTIDEPKGKPFSCPECRLKDKKIDELTDNLMKAVNHADYWRKKCEDNHLNGKHRETGT